MEQEVICMNFQKMSEDERLQISREIERDLVYKLIEDSNIRIPRPTTYGRLLDEAEKKVIKLFGVEINYWKRKFLRKNESRLLTLPEMAKVLEENSLVNNSHEGEELAKYFVNHYVLFGYGHRAVWDAYENRNRDSSYKLRYQAQNSVAAWFDQFEGFAE